MPWTGVEFVFIHRLFTLRDESDFVHTDFHRLFLFQSESNYGTKAEDGGDGEDEPQPSVLSIRFARDLGLCDGRSFTLRVVQWWRGDIGGQRFLAVRDRGGIRYRRL